jgi:hypothetical protein
MTEATQRRRWSRGALRALAWIAGGATFASSFASLTLSPKPATASDASQRPRRVIIVKKITRRVIVREAPEAPRYIYVGGGSSSGSTSSGGSTVAAAAPSSTTSTGGS